jgi:hypothetical protein
MGILDNPPEVKLRDFGVKSRGFTSGINTQQKEK